MSLRSAISRRLILASAALTVPTVASAQKADVAATVGIPSGPTALGVINVRDFGATGDGATDDAPAINRAIDRLREGLIHVTTFPVAPRLVFPAGIYAVESTINLTGLQALNMVIDGDGSVIHGRCAGQPVIDALGARWLMICDLTIVGDPVNVPHIGLQIGRVSDRVADNHRLVDVKILGHYALACLLNVAAETTGFDHLFLWNDRPDPASYCLIQDGLNHFGATSTFVSTRESRDRGDSFNENEFINCDFRHTGGGSPIWLGDTARHRFYRCYAAGGHAPAFVIYSGLNGHVMLDIDCHCEMSAPSSVFLFDSRLSSSLVIRGFSYQDHAPEASSFVLARSASVKHVTLQNTRIEIGSFMLPSCKLLDDPASWTISGTYYSSTSEQWNAEPSFTGTALLGDNVYQSPPNNLPK